MNCLEVICRLLCFGCVLACTCIESIVGKVINSFEFCTFWKSFSFIHVQDWQFGHQIKMMNVCQKLINIGVRWVVIWRLFRSFGICSFNVFDVLFVTKCWFVKIQNPKFCRIRKIFFFLNFQKWHQDHQYHLTCFK